MSSNASFFRLSKTKFTIWKDEYKRRMAFRAINNLVYLLVLLYSNGYSILLIICKYAMLNMMFIKNMITISDIIRYDEYFIILLVNWFYIKYNLSNFINKIIAYPESKMMNTIMNTTYNFYSPFPVLIKCVPLFLLGIVVEL